MARTLLIGHLPSARTSTPKDFGATGTFVCVAQNPFRRNFPNRSDLRMVMLGCLARARRYAAFLV
jgi:hypothetical protein